MQKDVREEFAALVAGPDEAIDLGRAALLIARSTQPDLDVEAYIHLLDLMADHLAVRIRGLSDPLPIIGEINRYLFEDEKFAGNTDTFYDPRNSFLNEVIDRKVGIPVSLSILYMEIGRRLNFRLEGVGLPGHFLIKHPGPSGDILIDPFNRGAILSELDCETRLEEIYGENAAFDRRYLQAMSKRRILSRMLSNLKAIYLHAQDLLAAIRMIDLALCLDPDNADDIRARGLLYYQLECFGQAGSDLERYLELRPDAEDQEVVRKYLMTARELTSKIN